MLKIVSEALAHKTFVWMPLFETRGGQSTLVSFVFIFLFVFALSAPLVEIIRYTSDAVSVASASNDVARAVAENPSMSEGERMDFFNRAYPNLAGANVEVTIGFPRSEEYQHHLPSADGTWNVRPSKTTSREVDVEVSIDRPWVTPLSSIILAITGTGQGDSYHIEAGGSACIDDTVSSGSW